MLEFPPTTSSVDFKTTFYIEAKLPLLFIMFYFSDLKPTFSFQQQKSFFFQTEHTPNFSINQRDSFRAGGSVGWLE